MCFDILFSTRISSVASDSQEENHHTERIEMTLKLPKRELRTFQISLIKVEDDENVEKER